MRLRGRSEMQKYINGFLRRQYTKLCRAIGKLLQRHGREPDQVDGSAEHGSPVLRSGVDVAAPALRLRPRQRRLEQGYLLAVERLPRQHRLQRGHVDVHEPLRRQRHLGLQYKLEISKGAHTK